MITVVAADPLHHWDLKLCLRTVSPVEVVDQSSLYLSCIIHKLFEPVL